MCFEDAANLTVINKQRGHKPWLHWDPCYFYSCATSQQEVLNKNNNIPKGQPTAVQLKNFSVSLWGEKKNEGEIKIRQEIPLEQASLCPNNTGLCQLLQKAEEGKKKKRGKKERTEIEKEKSSPLDWLRSEATLWFGCGCNSKGRKAAQANKRQFAFQASCCYMM